METEMTACVVETTRQFTTVDAACKFVRNCGKGTKFMVFVRAFLPTDENRGFDGSAALVVSRADMLKVIQDVGRTLVDKRGGRIVLRVNYPDELTRATWVSLH